MREHMYVPEDKSREMVDMSQLRPNGGGYQKDQLRGEKTTWLNSPFERSANSFLH
jgi:hypothetical protein